MAAKFTENCVTGDVLIITELVKYLSFTTAQTKFIIDLARTGSVAVESLLEHTISVFGNLERSNADGEDFNDKSDAKKGITCWGGKNFSTRTTYICNLKNKRGILRCMVADPISQRLYYFKIPYSFYKGRDRFSIPFDKYGFKASRSSSKVWDYEVPDFESICTK